MITLSEEQIGRLLVGRRVSISVGEPWDFASEDGDNILNGEIVGVEASMEPGESEKQKVRLAVTPFTARTGHRIEHLTAHARYVEDVGIIERLARGEDAEVNLSYVDQVPEDERDPRGSPKLVGGFRLSDR